MRELLGSPHVSVAFWIPKGLPAVSHAARSSSSPKLCSLASVNQWIPAPHCPSGHASPVPLFLSTIAQGLSWIFLSPLFPLTLGDPLSLHLSLVLRSAQFPSQSLTSFLSPLNLFIFFILTSPCGALIVCPALC